MEAQLQMVQNAIPQNCLDANLSAFLFAMPRYMMQSYTFAVLKSAALTTNRDLFQRMQNLMGAELAVAQTYGRQTSTKAEHDN